MCKYISYNCGQAIRQLIMEKMQLKAQTDDHPSASHPRCLCALWVVYLGLYKHICSQNLDTTTKCNTQKYKETQPSHKQVFFSILLPLLSAHETVLVPTKAYTLQHTC